MTSVPCSWSLRARSWNVRRSRPIVPRALRVEVRYLDRTGVAHEKEIAGVTAGTYQHEVDHLDGALFVDRVEDPNTLCTWKMFEEHHRADFEERIARLAAEVGS